MKHDDSAPLGGVLAFSTWSCLEPSSFNTGNFGIISQIPVLKYHGEADPVFAVSDVELDNLLFETTIQDFNFIVDKDVGHGISREYSNLEKIRDFI